MNNYSKLSEKDYNLEIIKKLESKNKISQTKANLFRVFTVLWKNPIINWKLISKWNQKWLISITHKVEWSQYSILWWQTKNVFKDQEQLGIFWKLIAKNIWWNQIQSTVFWWIQKAENIWASQIQDSILNFWIQKADKIWQYQIQDGYINIWYQESNETRSDQYQNWILNFWIQKAWKSWLSQLQHGIVNIWIQITNTFWLIQYQTWKLFNLYYQSNKKWFKWEQNWIIKLWVSKSTKKTWWDLVGE